MFYGTEFGNDFLNITPKTYKTKSKMDKKWTNQTTSNLQTIMK
jgi:hypothetical protein